MLPRWHMILGAAFTCLAWWIYPQIPEFYLLLILLASIFIDVDHYWVAVYKTGKIGFFNALEYHRISGEGAKKERATGRYLPGDFHVLHTVEFHALVLVFGLVWEGFYFVFIGMLFHSLLDFVYLWYTNWLFKREFFLARWLMKNI